MNQTDKNDEWNVVLNTLHDGKVMPSTEIRAISLYLYFKK